MADRDFIVSGTGQIDRQGKSENHAEFTKAIQFKYNK